MKYTFWEFWTNNIKSPPAREVWIEIQPVFYGVGSFPSPPAREVWIEICKAKVTLAQRNVTSRTGGVD